MTVPFEPRPNDPDADHLNTLLDAMRSGTRAPDPALPKSTEATALAGTAGKFRELVHRADAPAAAYLNDHPLQNRWEDVMSTAYPASPSRSTGMGHVPSPAPVSNRSRKMALPQSGNRLNGWLSAAIVAMLLLGTVGGAWWFGPGGDGPSDDSRMRLAAVTPEDSTPEAIWPEPLTPETDPWVAAITPDECTAEPMPYEEYAEAVTTDPGGLDRSYEIVGPADPKDAQAAVTVLRGSLACGIAGRVAEMRSYSTSESLFFGRYTIDNAPYQDELSRTKENVERNWTIWATETGLYPMSIIDGVEPPERALEIWEFSQGVLDEEETFISHVQTPVIYFEARFDPADAVMLDDGRMMIPTRYVYWADDPWVQQWGFSQDPNLRTQAMVLKRVEGEWKIDESMILICIGECDDVLTETGTPVPITTPAASPNAGTTGDAPAWLACPEENGPNRLSVMGNAVAEASPPASIDDWLPEPARPPMVPCPTPGPAEPGTPEAIPLN